MILIYGKGKSGNAVARLLEKKNIDYKITDDKDFKPSDLKNINEIVVSPGIPFFHPVFKLAREKRIPIIGEVELAYKFFKGKVIAITGTDGKSTTAKLIHHLIGNEKAQIGGNYGTPFSELILKSSRKTTVLELSSFQIYSLKNFKPEIAVFLNFSTDHLDWHRKLCHYKLSKYKLFRNQTEKDITILNYDDTVVKNCTTRGRKYYFSLKKLPRNVYGAYFEKNKIILKIKNQKMEIDSSVIPLKGLHNIQNAMAAVLTAYFYGIKFEIIKERLKTFEPLPHRMEYIETINGIQFYNDAKATTVQAVKKALQSFNGKKIVLITGGINKGGDFSVLKDELKKNVKKVFIIGKDKEQIFSMIKDYTSCEKVDTLESAVNHAYLTAEKGDVILLSPGCASFDMFKNYKDRGDRFKNLVKELKNG
ncbi:UDP-N-acetylmuramoyl-L-alanine--D-glutamate ligase [Persephonella sp.]